MYYVHSRTNTEYELQVVLAIKPSGCPGSMRYGKRDLNICCCVRKYMMTFLGRFRSDGTLMYSNRVGACSDI